MQRFFLFLVFIVTVHPFLESLRADELSQEPVAVPILWEGYRFFLEAIQDSADDWNLYHPEEWRGGLRRTYDWRGRKHYWLAHGYESKPIPLLPQEAALFLNWLNGVSMNLQSSSSTAIAQSNVGDLLQDGIYHFHPMEENEVGSFFEVTLDSESMVALAPFTEIEGEPQSTPMGELEQFIIDLRNPSGQNASNQKNYFMIEQRGTTPFSWQKSSQASCSETLQAERLQKITLLQDSPPQSPEQKSWFQRWFPCLSGCWNVCLNNWGRLCSWWKEPGLLHKLFLPILFAWQGVATVILGCASVLLVLVDIAYDFIIYPFTYVFSLGGKAI